MITEIDVTNYLNEEEIKELARESVKEYMKSKLNENVLTGDKETFKSFFETVALNYMIDNHKEELDNSIKSCLEYITTIGLFRPRYYDYNNASKRLEDIFYKHCSENKDIVLNTMIDKIKTCNSDEFSDVMSEVMNNIVYSIFSGEIKK